MTAPSVDRSWRRGQSESRDQFESSVIIYLNVANHNVLKPEVFLRIVSFRKSVTGSNIHIEVNTF